MMLRLALLRRRLLGIGGDRIIKAWKNFSSSDKATEKLTSPVGYRPTQETLLQSKQQLERILSENILPFWYPQVIDWEDGGYRLNHDLHGQWKGRANKHLVSQARTVWFFSRLAKSPYGMNEHLDAARHGYVFLRDRLWDQNCGGFYWEVDSSGQTAVKPDKHLYGQAFGLYALSEYATASGDPTATALAQELFRLWEIYAHDSQHGGYQEFFQHDWSAGAGDCLSYMNTAPTMKLMNTHLHLLEALTAFYLMTQDSLVKERLSELILVHSNSVVRKIVGSCTDKHQRDWIPLQGPAYDRVSYGHDLENISLLVEACEATRLSNSLLLDLYRTLFHSALRYGFDRKAGGFYDSGPFHAPADRQEKVWWVQAEGLVCALQMYRLTSEELYWRCFCQTLDWIAQRQADWEHGDWYERVAQNGKPLGDKAGAWKAPYHNGRAIIQSLELLSFLNESSLSVLTPSSYGS
jgi:mannose/cellobiose epimerase-like protein (N-acyl-D-glucosamine 2-epimerase family)